MTHIDTVAPTDLIRSSWGNNVASELNTKSVKANGQIGDGLTPTNQWMTGSLVINASPALKLRRSDNAPYFQFESTAATRFAFIQGSAGLLKHNVDGATGIITLEVNDAERLRVDINGVDITGALTVTGTSTLGKGRFGGNGAQIELIDTSTSGSDFHDAYMAFYGAGVSMVSPGTRTGYFGFAGSTTLQARNEVANGGLALIGNGSGTIALTTGVSGDITMTTGAGGNVIVNAGGVIVFDSGGSERGRVAGSLMWGKSTGGSAQPGVELFEAGTIYSTTPNNGVPNMLLRHNVNADDVAYVQFANASGGILSEINQDNVSPVGIKISNCAVTAPSDYRLKNDLGPIVGALDRVMQLLPKHLAWKDTGAEFDGFIAHEVAPIVPQAVFGEKDAVYDADEAQRKGVEPGSIKSQEFMPEPLIPLLTAGLQELAAKVFALEGAA